MGQFETVSFAESGSAAIGHAITNAEYGFHSLLFYGTSAEANQMQMPESHDLRPNTRSLLA
jgi:hypothetical protein